MADLIKAIIRYETARQVVVLLSNKRADLLSSCKELQGADPYEPSPDICLKTVHYELMTTIRDNPGEGWAYSEVIEEMRCDDNVCDGCYESYELKRGALADARHEFGNAKRALSVIGKQLISGANKT